jgi:hypothetical protein
MEVLAIDAKTLREALFPNTGPVAGADFLTWSLYQMLDAWQQIQIAKPS